LIVHGREDFESIEILRIIGRLGDARATVKIKKGDMVLINWFNSQEFYEGKVVETHGRLGMHIDGEFLLVDEAFKVVMSADVEKIMKNQKDGNELCEDRSGDFIQLINTAEPEWSRNEGKVGYLFFKDGGRPYFKEILSGQEKALTKKDKVEVLMMKEVYIKDTRGEKCQASCKKTH
jgi:hypothetical protein